jgi:hypothetical protein
MRPWSYSSKRKPKSVGGLQQGELAVPSFSARATAGNIGILAILLRAFAATRNRLTLSDMASVAALGSRSCRTVGSSFQSPHTSNHHDASCNGFRGNRLRPNIISQQHDLRTVPIVRPTARSASRQKRTRLALRDSQPGPALWGRTAAARA